MLRPGQGRRGNEILSGENPPPPPPRPACRKPPPAFSFFSVHSSPCKPYCPSPIACQIYRRKRVLCIRGFFMAGWRMQTPCGKKPSRQFMPRRAGAAQPRRYSKPRALATPLPYSGSAFAQFSIWRLFMNSGASPIARAVLPNRRSFCSALMARNRLPGWE